MSLRSFMVILLAAGALATTIPNKEKNTSQAESTQLMIEEYTFEPIHIYVPRSTQDVGLD